jgi:hypothetical protein
VDSHFIDAITISLLKQTNLLSHASNVFKKGQNINLLLPYYINTTMSSQTYVYIPNLVGRQMLRIPVIPCEEADYSEEPELSTSNASTFDFVNTTTTSRPTSRESSPSPSVSVESVDELE